MTLSPRPSGEPGKAVRGAGGLVPAGAVPGLPGAPGGPAGPSDEPQGRLCGSCREARLDPDEFEADLCSWCREEKREAEKARSRRREADSAALGGLRALETFTFETFRARPGSEAALAAAKAFDPKKSNLYLFGPTGTGKSHLAAGSARRFLADGPKTRVATLKPGSLSREVRTATMRDGADAEATVIRKYVEMPVLVIDDIGVAKETEFSLAVLYEVIDGRYMNRPGGLVVTSNLRLGELAEKLQDDRIPSRLAEMCVFASLDGVTDFRVGRPAA